MIHRLRDAIVIPFSGFFLQARSLRGHINFLKKKRAAKNRKSLFGIERLLSDNQVRNILDSIPTCHLEDAQDDLIFKMQRSAVLKDFRKSIHVRGEQPINLGYLLPLDGLETFRSEKIHCPSCCVAHHKDGRIDYFHRVLLSGLVHPKKNLFLPLTQEFIVKQDGSEKEDCERNAAKRWLRKFRKKHPQLPVTILGDDAFCTQPYICALREALCGFVLCCQPGSHKTLFEWVETARQGGDLITVTKKVRVGRRLCVATCEYMNNVPLKDGEDAIKVNFVHLTIRDRITNEVVGVYSFVTDFLLTKGNCMEIASVGRKRWKIENEGNNTLTNNGYQIKHNFGHGKQNASQNFVLLALLAFMMHEILSYVDQEGFSKVRKAMDSLYECFYRLLGTFSLVGVNDWERFYEVALEGLDSS